MTTNLIVLAKAPEPGRVKTRLTPPFTPVQAAQLAGAALTDTLLAACATPGARTVLVLAGAPGGWRPELDVEVLPQRAGGLDERIAAAFADVGGPALLIGMDTPQVSPDLLAASLAALEHHDALLGPAEDGGYWAIGLRAPRPDLVVGVPMSRSDTGACQRRRLEEHGLAVHPLPVLRDVDRLADAAAVAAVAPASRFARTLGPMVAALPLSPWAEGPREAGCPA
jgi:rSAM/selenodomain-associated transferase 1